MPERNSCPGLAKPTTIGLGCRIHVQGEAEATRLGFPAADIELWNASQQTLEIPWKTNPSSIWIWSFGIPLVKSYRCLHMVSFSPHGKEKRQS
jgi:hypothetical protein